MDLFLLLVKNLPAALSVSSPLSPRAVDFDLEMKSLRQERLVWSLPLLDGFLDLNNEEIEPPEQCLQNLARAGMQPAIIPDAISAKLHSGEQMTDFWQTKFIPPKTNLIHI